MAHDFYEYTKELIPQKSNNVFGYTIINHIPIFISGNVANGYFKKKATVQMANPYPADAIVYDNSGIAEPKEKQIKFFCEKQEY